MVKVYSFFSVQDILLGLLVLVVIYFYYNKRKSKILDEKLRKYYFFNFHLKLFLGLLYALYYYFIVGGGDTLAYWDGAISLNQLFSFSPSMYFEEMLNEPSREMNWRHFNRFTGYPPGWIYRETESWFVSKTMSVISFITFKSYIGATFLLGYISSLASWRLFQLIKNIGLHEDKFLAISILFIPSVSFWCSGVTKDTLVLLSVIFIVCNLYELILNSKKDKFKKSFVIAFYCFILFHIRDFMLMAISIPFIFMLSARFANKYRKNKISFYSIRMISFILVILFLVFQGESLQESKELEQAAIIQEDMANNETYEGARYDIGVTDFTPFGMLKAFPNAVIAGIYRPFIWEAFSPTLIFNGIEGVYFMYLTWLFFKKDFFRKVKIIRKSEFLVFAFLFSLILAYVAGLTSGLLGVLVRFKAPVVPFILIVLTIQVSKLSDVTK